MTQGKEKRIHDFYWRACLPPSPFGLWRTWPEQDLRRIRFSPSCQHALSGLMVVAMMVLPAGTAWSLQEVQKPVSFMEEPAQAPQISSLSVTDLCLPLLKSLHQHSPNTVTERTQRPAGTAAAASALGFVFGARYALGPVVDARAKVQAERICRK